MKRIALALVLVGCGSGKSSLPLELASTVLSPTQAFESGAMSTLTMTATRDVTVELSWGDGSTASVQLTAAAPVTATHQYKRLGAFSVAADVCVGERCTTAPIGTVMVSCTEQGTDDCNADIADGCEVNTLTNPDHCGACGDTCAAAVGCVEAETCVDGGCQAGAGCPVFVDSAMGMDVSGCGVAWGTLACASLQGAVDEAQATNVPRVFAKAGTYTDVGDQVVSIPEGIELYGGFSGTENLLSERPQDPLAVPSTIDGEGNRQGVYTNDDAVLDGFLVRGGNAAYGGGMVAVQNDGVTVRNVVFQLNHASGSNGGGGLYVNRATKVTLSDILFKHNTSSGDGAGMYSRLADVTMTDVTFQENAAYSAHGGGLAGHGGTAIMTGVRFLQNQVNSSQNGAGAHLRDMDLTLTDVDFIQNSGSGSGQGGGAYMDGGTATLTDVLFDGNALGTSGQGLGLYVNETDLTASDVVFDGNNTPSSQADGGGMYRRGSGKLHLRDVVFRDNTLGFGGAGGGLYTQQSTDLVLSKVLFERNGTDGQGVGGGLYADSNAVSLIDVRFIGNWAGSSSSYTALGGGAYFSSSASTTMTNVLFQDNFVSASGSGFGGGVFAQGQTSMTNVSFIANSAFGEGARSGAGLYIATASAKTLTNTVFESNAASSGQDVGGALGPLTITHSCVQSQGIANRDISNVQLSRPATTFGPDKIPFLVQDSECVDIGDDATATNAYAAAALLDWTQLTTDKTGGLDATPVDAGFHHPPSR